MQAVAGAGFDWKFSEEAVGGGILMRMMSMVVSIGGMLITALLLGIVSGQHDLPQRAAIITLICWSCCCSGVPLLDPNMYRWDHRGHEGILHHGVEEKHICSCLNSTEYRHPLI